MKTTTTRMPRHPPARSRKTVSSTELIRLRYARVAQTAPVCSLSLHLPHLNGQQVRNVKEKGEDWFTRSSPLPRRMALTQFADTREGVLHLQLLRHLILQRRKRLDERPLVNLVDLDAVLVLQVSSRTRHRS